MLIATSVLVAANWGLFIWAVQTGQTVEASLGYYVLPLVNVAFGVVLLREPLGYSRAVAIGLAVMGVSVLAIGLGVTPWIAIGRGE